MAIKMDLRRFRNLKSKSPYVILLIGPPLSGKTSFYNEFINNIDSDVDYISRDEILMDVYGSRDYDEAFDKVDQKEVDDALTKKFVQCNGQRKNVIVDMTHMGSKRRRQNLNYFGEDYYKLGVIFPILTDDEYVDRNQKRREKENKNIPLSIVKRMIKSYQTIKPDEGFDRVISI